AKVLRKIIEIDEELCNGCGNCVLACQEGAIAIVDGKAKLISEFLCDGFGACIGECPTGALKIVEREAEEFDEEAVKAHLAKLKEEKLKEEKQGFSEFACGCPSHQLREFTITSVKEDLSEIPSALTHWPVQIRLIPSSAPFLEGAKLLVCADCVPVAYPNLHLKLLPEKKIMLGCPKFDPADLYIEKFAEILAKRNLESLELAIMEVPCCKGLLHILSEARKLAKREIPIKVYTISVKGTVLTEEVY
ncbi:MAG: ATP-binding protein, partial [Caldimicrobium sp.]